MHTYFTTAITILTLVTTAVARPNGYGGYGSQTGGHSTVGIDKPSTCLTNDEADDIVKRMSIIFSGDANYKQVAENTLAENYTAVSDSFSLISGNPLNTTGTTSRADLLQQLGKLGEIPVIKTLYEAHICDAIFWYFEFERTPLPVRNFGVFFVNEEKKVYKSYRELNSAAALINMDRPLPQNYTVGKEGLPLLKEGCDGYYT